MQRAVGRAKVREGLLRDPKTGKVTFEKVIATYMPDTVKDLLANEPSLFHIEKVRKRSRINQRGPVILHVPEVFSITDKPETTYDFLAQSLAMVLFGKNSDIRFDYSDCERVDVGAQVLLDIILIDVIAFFKKCTDQGYIRKKYRWVMKAIGATNLNKTNEPIQQILRSIGSLAIFRAKESFANIISCPLESFRRDPRWTNEAAAEHKEVETTKLVQYVEDCLARVNRTLTLEKLDNLSIVIGEALANAEEHSSTHRRISIGYFRQDDGDPERIGVFRLVILNFGTTIYEKFSDPLCPNPKIVSQMRALSARYTRSGLFSFGRFGEEELWTLYALQEGVTSVDPRERRRGKGTIRYIENFFDIKGSPGQDEVSRMTLLSGNTRITFDGKYRTRTRKVGIDELRVMTFNNAASLEKPPDQNYVETAKSYFPGVCISARILLQKDDTTNA